MATIYNDSAVYDFNLEEIAMLFGVTLNQETPEKDNIILVLAPVVSLIRDMVLRKHPVPASLYDVCLTLSCRLESIIYPDADGGE